MTFTLNTTFSDEALSTLYQTGTNVVVAKPAIGNAPNVAWVVFRPLEENTLTWDEQYGIYASTQSIQNGAVLTQIAATPFPAGDGLSYTLLPAGFFGSPTSGGTPGSFTAVNQFNNLPPSGPGFMTLGLYQNATVNGTTTNGNAVSAAAVPYQSTAVITPFTTVFLWTQSQVTGNSVVTDVTSAQTQVGFGGSVTEVSLVYDQASGVFAPAGGAVEIDKKTGRIALAGGKLPAGISLGYHMPLLG